MSMVGISSRTTLIAKMRRLGINPGQSSGLSLRKVGSVAISEGQRILIPASSPSMAPTAI